MSPGIIGLMRRVVKVLTSFELVLNNSYDVIFDEDGE